MLPAQHVRGTAGQKTPPNTSSRESASTLLNRVNSHLNACRLTLVEPHCDPLSVRLFRRRCGECHGFPVTVPKSKAHLRCGVFHMAEEVRGEDASGVVQSPLKAPAAPAASSPASPASSAASLARQTHDSDEAEKASPSNGRLEVWQSPVDVSGASDGFSADAIVQVSGRFLTTS